MRLTLLIPELIWPEPGDAETFAGLACPALATLLARGRRADAARSPNTAATFDAAIARAFGLDRAVPYAALRLLGEGLDPGEQLWACADPVHLRFHQERLILADGTRIEISAAEAEALTGELNRFFGDVGEFRAAAPERWYLRLSAAADFETPPLSAMAGRRVDRQLPEEGRTAWLRKLLNEAQMLLHGHAVNEARADAGRMTVNSLWLWGPGALPRGLQSDWSAVCSDHPLARGMARCAGVPAHAAPAGFAALEKQVSGDGKVLVTLESLLRAVQYEDAEAWRDGLAALERDWFAPLVAAIRRGRVSLDLRASTIYGELGWEVGRGELWRFWQRPQPLQAVAQALAEGGSA
ncbi:hypothetical protein [Azospira restricta]|uniref:Phosphoglycerate mutase n=1 Tax=Azospira restricta TaxID=404405 RepID=A0A974SN85_9RHOO|nr:hypothetical protein [Azospira restricta]QRJ62468.1 hypothetical protein IWH25_11810 [Azospira restricta]